MTRKFPPAVASVLTPEGPAAVLRRRYSRAAVDLPARYAIEGQPAWHASIIDELGGGGLRLQTEEDVAAGTIVALQFELDGVPIAVTARVAMSLFDRSRARFLHGVAFTSIEPLAREAIVNRVSALGG
jgi:hypothetical protein